MLLFLRISYEYSSRYLYKMKPYRNRWIFTGISRYERLGIWSILPGYCHLVLRQNVSISDRNVVVRISSRNYNKISQWYGFIRIHSIPNIPQIWIYKCQSLPISIYTEWLWRWVEITITNNMEEFYMQRISEKPFSVSQI